MPAPAASLLGGDKASIERPGDGARPRRESGTSHAVDAMHDAYVVPPKSSVSSEPSSFLTTQEAAARAGVSAASVRRWLREGTLDGVRVVGRLRVDAADLEQVITRAAAIEEES